MPPWKSWAPNQMQWYLRSKHPLRWRGRYATLSLIGSLLQRGIQDKTSASYFLHLTSYILLLPMQLPIAFALALVS